MRLSSRSYPHPVLGNRDDLPNAEFQTTLEMSTDQQAVYVTAQVACTSELLNDLINENKAVFILHVECSNTLFRSVYEFRDLQYRVSIPTNDLNDTVEVNVFALASQPIPDYRPPEAHPDYAAAVFAVQRGDILAIGEGQVFHVESSFDSFTRIGSIMQISESQSDGDVPMESSFEGNKIVIFLSKEDFRAYKRLKSHKGLRDPLTTTIVLPVLIEALHVLKEEQPGGIEANWRWMRALTRRIESLDLSTEIQPLQLAQMLLELPVRRVLAASTLLAEADS